MGVPYESQRQKLQKQHWATTMITQVVAKDGRVVLNTTCENMGLQFSAQLKRLKRSHWAVVSMMDTTGRDGKIYQMAKAQPHSK